MNNLTSLPTALTFVQTSGYFIMFLLMVFEGPIITTAAAFAASLGLFNIYLIFTLSLLGNLVGDLTYFFIGKIGRNFFVNRHLKYFKIGKKGIKRIESVLKNNPIKAMLTIKLTPNLAGPGLILAGAVDMPFKKFISLSFIISFVYSLFFSLVGFYMGMAFGNILKYFDYVGWIISFLIAVALIFFIIYHKFSKRIYSKLKNFKNY